MDEGAGHEAERPLPRQPCEAEDEIGDLQDRDRLDSAVKGLGQEVPEDLGPEEALKSSGDLVWAFIMLVGRFATVTCVRYGKRARTSCRGEGDESCPVVLDQPSHLDFSPSVPCRLPVRSPRLFHTNYPVW